MEIKIENLSITMNSNIVFNDVSYTFKDKKITSIIGPMNNNSELLFDAIFSLKKILSGKIIVGNNTITSNTKELVINKKHCDVGYLFENKKEQFFNNTVYDEISYGMKNFNYKLDNIDKHVIDSLKMVGLNESIIKLDPNDLSSGEQTKVAFSSILALNPKVLLLNEPTTNLDYKSKNYLIKLIRRLKLDYKKTIVIISSDIEFVHKVSDDILIFNKKIINSGNKRDIFKNTQLFYENDIELPNTILFKEKAMRKNVKLEITNDIKDLLKDIYRNV